MVGLIFWQQPCVGMLPVGPSRLRVLPQRSLCVQTYADAMDAGTMTLADVLDAATSTALPVRLSLREGLAVGLELRSGQV